MRKYIFIIIIFLFSFFHTNAKGKWDLDIGTSIGFHTSSVYLWNYKVENSMIWGLYTGLSYEQYITKKVGISASVQYYQLFHDVTVGNDEISGTNFVLKIPVYGHYHWNKYDVFGGIAMQNYREIKDMAIQKSHNLRWQLEAGFAMPINEKWSIKASYSHLLSEKLDSLLAMSYSNQINIGVVLNLSELFKKKTNEKIK